MSDQYTPEQRTFMALEYHKVRDTPNCIKLVRELFAQKFPGVRVPHRNNVRKVWKEQQEKFSDHNLNSKSTVLSTKLND